MSLNQIRIIQNIKNFVQSCTDSRLIWFANIKQFIVKDLFTSILLSLNKNY